MTGRAAGSDHAGAAGRRQLDGDASLRPGLAAIASFRPLRPDRAAVSAQRLVAPLLAGLSAHQQ